MFIQCRDVVGEIDDVAVFNYFYLCFWHWDVFGSFFFQLVKDLQTQTLLFLPRYSVILMKKHSRERKLYGQTALVTMRANHS